MVRDKSSEVKLTALPVNPEGIPDFIKAISRTVCWSNAIKKDRDGTKKLSKAPIDPKDGSAAKSTDKEPGGGKPKLPLAVDTWGTFEQALAWHQKHPKTTGGIGIVLAGEQPSDTDMIGIDLDNCRNPDTGEFLPWAKEVFRLLQTYAEVSPTGTGAKLFIRGSCPAWLVKHKRQELPDWEGGTNGKIELYATGRYFTLTGHLVPGQPATVEPCVDAAEQLYRRLFPEKDERIRKDLEKWDQAWPAFFTPRHPDDVNILDLARRAKNGDKFARLYDQGDIGGYPSQSEADLALCGMLAFYTGPNSGDHIIRLFNDSRLAGEKWKREDYRDRTIKRVFSESREYYDWNRRNGKPTLPPPPALDDQSLIDTKRGTAAPATVQSVIADPWPKEIRPAAFNGSAGDFVDAVLPYTEAHPVALLLQFLAGFGNAIGRTLHFCVEGSIHYLNLFVVLVGKTSKGRKGTSWGRVRQYLDKVDPHWLKERVQGGLCSGEGFVWQIRDEVRQMMPVKGKGGRIETHEETVVDHGVLDKRLLCLEEEYTGVIRMMERSGSNLEQRLREAWDGRRVGSMTKNSLTRCNEPHVSIVGHTAMDEVRRYLTLTSAASGFGNRHLWALVQRSKSLPHGALHDPDPDVAQRMQLAYQFATNPQVTFNNKELRRNADADKLWEQVYDGLSEGQPGMAGAMLGRAEAYVMRLACLYAALERSEWITSSHLESALAVWDYCAESVRVVFGDSTGNDLADEIMRLLRSREGGATRTDIMAHFGRNRTAEAIGCALAVLDRHKLAHSETVQTGGRPAEKWMPGVSTKETKETK